MLTNFILDYSMLSKTNVHHFAGNNVSYTVRPIYRKTMLRHTLDLSLGGLPYEEILFQELGGLTHVLTIANRLSWVPHAESSIAVRRWLCWMLVILIF